MKTRRHAKVLEIINSNHVETQEELQARLQDAGFTVTQATVSRDIKELRLVKRPDDRGGYSYGVAQNGVEPISAKFHSIIANAVVDVRYAQNIVVIKCLPGMANGACAAMDSMNFRQIVGTLAGDDTIFCVVTNERDAEDVVLELKRTINRVKEG